MIHRSQHNTLAHAVAIAKAVEEESVAENISPSGE
jgi:hypothetical protein